MAQNVNHGLHLGKVRSPKGLRAVWCPTVGVILGIVPDSVLSPHHLFAGCLRRSEMNRPAKMSFIYAQSA